MHFQQKLRVKTNVKKFNNTTSVLPKKPLQANFLPTKKKHDDFNSLATRYNLIVVAILNIM